MTELDLYKYITDNQIEWHRQNNDGTPDVIIFPHIFQMADFNKLVKSMLDDEGLECRMKDGYFAFWMNDICDHYGIDINKVFIGEEQ
jgi:hypothetical protein